MVVAACCSFRLSSANRPTSAMPIEKRIITGRTSANSTAAMPLWSAVEPAQEPWAPGRHHSNGSLRTATAA